MSEVLHSHDQLLESIRTNTMSRLDLLGIPYTKEKTLLKLDRVQLPYRLGMEERVSKEANGASIEHIQRAYTYVLNELNELATIQATAMVLEISFEESALGYKDGLPYGNEVLSDFAYKFAVGDRSISEAKKQILEELAICSLSPLTDQHSSQWKLLDTMLPSLAEYDHRKKLEFVSEDATKLETHVLMYTLQSLGFYMLIYPSKLKDAMNDRLQQFFSSFLQADAATYNPKTGEIHMRYEEWNKRKIVRNLITGSTLGTVVYHILTSMKPEYAALLPCVFMGSAFLFHDVSVIKNNAKNKHISRTHEILHELSASHMVHEDGTIHEKFGLMRFTS